MSRAIPSTGSVPGPRRTLADPVRVQTLAPRRVPGLVPGLVVGLGAVVALSLAPTPTAAGGFPELIITPQSVDLTEGEGWAFGVSLSQPPTGFTFVQIVTVDGTAVAGEDYVAVAQNLTWDTGETFTQKVFVETIDDAVDEGGTESFFLQLGASDGASFGDRSTASIQILDDDGSGSGLTGTIVVDGAVQNGDGVHVFMVESGETIDIDVELSEVPTTPISVPWTSSLEPFSGTLEFDGTRFASATLTGPEPGEAPAATGSFALAVTRGEPDIDWGWVSSLIAAGELDPVECAFCYLYYLYHVSGIGECPFECLLSSFCDLARGLGGGLDPNPALDALRDYRDDVLMPTPTGQFYVDLYEEHEVDAIAALLGDPTLVFRVLEATDEWIPAIRALVDGGGAGVTVTSSMQASLLVVLAGMEEHASPALASAIATERTRLQLTSIEGLTMDGFQQQIESLGGTPVARTSWSELKSIHR